MTLSVCCFTNGPAAFVAAQLALFAEVADEIVVAVDDRAPPAVAKACRAVPARVISRRWVDPLERSLAWLHEQCHGEWILRVDSDEIASPRLLRELPRLLSESELTHYWIPRRHLYPDFAHYLSQRPWHPDPQLRLVRNDPELLRFSGRVHSSVEPAGAGDRAKSPLYHAEPLLLSRAQRLAKGRRYAALAGVPPADAVVVLLPDDVPSPRVRPVPQQDLAVLRALLDRKNDGAGG